MTNETGHEDALKGASEVQDLSEAVYLHCWQELIGDLQFVSTRESSLVLQLGTESGSIKLTFDKESPEAQQIRDALSEVPVGSSIGILKTDSRVRPVLVRRIRN